ncbi:MAG: four helix bundle protein, partial [Cyanobium sp. ELA507]
AYDAALAMVAALRPALARLTTRDRALADQVRRAASSVVLNLAEGNRRTGQDRVQFFKIAAGSAAEVRAALAVARAWGYIEGAAEAERELDRVLAMVWRLTQPRRP